MKKKRASPKPKTNKPTVEKVARFKTKGKSAKAKKAKSAPLPSDLENWIKKQTENNKTRFLLREKARKLYEFRENDSSKALRQVLTLLKTSTKYDPQFRFKSYHPYGNKKARKIWVDTFTGKKGHWREWNGEYKRTPTGKIRKRKDAITGEMKPIKVYKSIMEKEYLKVSREMQIRILQSREGLNRAEAVVQYTDLASKGRSFVFEQIGSRR